jgi:hypothetical protein
VLIRVASPCAGFEPRPSIARYIEVLECGDLILLHILSMLYINRNHPARRVLEDETLPTLVFATICTKKRRPWLATPLVHRVLRSAWLRHKNWIVSAYVVMPDHVHFFAEPGTEPGTFDDWITCWKRGAGRLLKNPIAGGRPDPFIIASVALKTPSKSESTWMRIRCVPGL